MDYACPPDDVTVVSYGELPRRPLDVVSTSACGGSDILMRFIEVLAVESIEGDLSHGTGSHRQYQSLIVDDALFPCSGYASIADKIFLSTA